MLLKLLLLGCLLAGPALAQSVRQGPPTHRIPDPALRRMLARQGFITNGALNSKAYHWDQLHISGEGIKSLAGIQYMGRVKELYITGTRLRRLDFLPPNVDFFVCSDNELESLPALPPYLRSLNCDHNRLTRLPPLPATLTSLACGYNRLTALPPLPPRLEWLGFSHNRLTRLPPLPLRLTYLNYAQNPIPTSALPAAYRPLPCRAADQNCQPNPLVNWHILAASIPDTAFAITGFQVVTNSDENMTGAISRETVLFRPQGNNLVAGSQRTEKRDYARSSTGFYLKDSTYDQPVSYAVAKKRLKQILDDIYANELTIKLTVNDSLRTIDLRYKNLAQTLARDCSDCGNQEITYLIDTSSGPIRLQDTLDFMGLEPISKPPNPRPQVRLLDWLYMYRLTQATIPNNEMVKHYFRKQGLQDILSWVR